MLPPLPLIDGTLFIDNSSWMETIGTCSRKLQYQSLNKRISIGEKPALNFGSAFHLALEHRYKTYGNKPVDDKYYEEASKIFTDFFAEHPTPDGDWRTLNYAMTMLRKYNERYDIEPFNLLTNKQGEVLVEMSFALPLFTWEGVISGIFEGFGAHTVRIPIIYTGRIDLPISIDGQVFVMDHKTNKQLGQSFWDEMRVTAQMRGYVWAYRQLTGMPCKGYVVNGIRTKEPPDYVLAGKTSTRGGKTRNAQDWWQDTFNREMHIVTDSMLDEWKLNTIKLVERFFREYQEGYMPMQTKWCSNYGKCPYYDVCRLDVDDRESFLRSGSFTDNTWTPLKK